MKNKRLVAIAVNTEKNLCTCIYSYATFKQLEENYMIYHKDYSSTNWNGCDEVKRTLELKNLKLTGKTFKHMEVVVGVDHDMGHEYDWRFLFDTVMEVEKPKKDDVIIKLTKIIQEENNGKVTAILNNAISALRGMNNEND